METLKNEEQMSEAPTSEVALPDAVNGKDQPPGEALTHPDAIENQIPGDDAVARRVITTHYTDAGHNYLVVRSHDAPGPGGAHHNYSIWWQHPEGGPGTVVHLPFQKGGLQEVGPNGVTQEALLAIVRDRLEGFQSGPFACEENKAALEFTIAAMEALKARTMERMGRGVEGKQEV